MAGLQIGRLLLSSPFEWAEPLGDSVGSNGGAVVPVARSAPQFQATVSTKAAVGQTDTTAARLALRRRLRSMLNNSPLKFQALYALVQDDPEQSGWYVPDVGLLQPLSGASGLALGLWQLQQLNLYLVGHQRLCREARQVWLKDLRSGLYPRDSLGWVLSTDFAALPALGLSVLPSGVSQAALTVSGQVVVPSVLPAGRDGGSCAVCSGLSDLGVVSYERPEASLNLGDVVAFDRRGLVSQLPETQYENLIPNPSFEYDTVGAAPSSWTSTGDFLVSGATLTVVAGPSFVGTKAMSVTTTTASSEGAQCELPGTFKAGQPYTIAVYLNGNLGTESVNVYCGDGSGSGDFAAVGPIATPIGWARHTVTWTPTLDRTGRVAVAVRSAASGVMTWFVDAVQVTQSAAAVPYFDGDSAGAGWVGTPGNAPSLLPPVNLVSNPNFEHGTNGSAPAGWTAVGAGTPIITNVQAQSGSQSMAVAVTGATQGACALLGVVNGGSPVTASVWVRTPTTQNMVIAMQDNALGNGVVSQTVSCVANTWTKLTVTWTPTAYSANAAVYVYTATSVTETFYVDNAQVSYGPSAPASYNDGDSTGWMWKGTIGNSISVQVIDPQVFGWEEAYGPDYPWNWQTAGQPQDAPVLDNGLCRVRYDASVGQPGLRVDVWNGSAYVEQGKLTFERIGDSNGFDDTWVSASLVEYTPERAVLSLVLRRAADTASRERVFITMQRGQVGCTIECYPALKAAGTIADMLIAWTPAQADVNDSVIKMDSLGATPLPSWTPGAAGTGKITATAGSGSSAWSGAAIGATTFTASENWIAVLRCSATATVTAYQANLGVLQAANLGAATLNATTAYGAAQNAVYVLSSGGGGYASVDLSFTATQAQQVLEAESITLGTGTTNTTDAAASNGHAATATRTTDANLHASQANWPNSFQGVYRVFARVKVSANSASFYAKTGATTGITVTGINSTTYVWVDLGEIVANNTTLEIHAWMSGGAGTVSVDRTESFLTQDRVRTGAIFSGARDAGQSALTDSRMLGSVVAR